jgi:hypothetical protein
MFWALLIFLQQGKTKLSVLFLLISLCGLSIIRFHAYLVFLLAIVPITILLLRNKQMNTAVYLFGICLITVFISHQLYINFPFSWPDFSKTTPNVITNTLTDQAAFQIASLNAQEGDNGYDETTAKWVDRFRENPVLAVIKTIARTLFAPYPWVAIYPGLTYTSFSELYYPGNLLWMIFLPAFFTGVICFGWTKTHSRLFLAVWLSIIVFAYILVQGEFSTRQRVFAMPLLWIIVAVGCEKLLTHWKLRKVKACQSR